MSTEGSPDEKQIELPAGLAEGTPDLGDSTSHESWLVWPWLALGVNIGHKRSHQIEVVCFLSGDRPPNKRAVLIAFTHPNRVLNETNDGAVHLYVCVEKKGLEWREAY